MFIKKLILFKIFFNISLFIFSECLVLKDGTIFNGKLITINKDNILLEINYKLLEFPFNSIDYLIHNNSQEKESILIIENKNKITKNINLVKATGNAIFYKIPNNNDLNIILLSDINIIKIENTLKNKNNSEKFKIETMDDINKGIDYLINLLKNNKLTTNILDKKDIKNNKSLSYIFLNINELDYYEKFWEKINYYITEDTKNLLWNLYELYSNKEKYLNIIYNNNIQRINNFNKKSLQNNNKDISEADFLNNKFIKLRKEFYLRAKKIIYNNELLINYINK